MHTEAIDLSASREIHGRFKEVLLSTSLTAVHKHGVGSCEGRPRL
jgi:hypothetical protein